MIECFKTLLTKNECFKSYWGGFGKEKQFSYEKMQYKITNINSKLNRLLDLYLNGDISDVEYKKKKAEMESGKKPLYQTEKSIKDDYKSVLDGIRDYIKKIIYGMWQDEIFYKNIVEKIVVYDRRNIEVFLKIHRI